MKIEISAVICTHNRKSYLRKAIKSIINQTLDSNLYEIIIVDNASSDNTGAMVSDEFKMIKNLKYFFEPVQGLSHSRNTGWKNALGKYVAYLDDDAIAYPGWLETILLTFQSREPQPACVGGNIEPIWESTRPSWLSDDIISCLGVLEGPDKPAILKGDNWLGGGNSAYSKEILKITGGFPTNLGRVGKKLLSNEENFIRRKIIEKGYYCFFHPEITIGHHIPKSRLNKRWFMRRFYWQGISDATMKIEQESLDTLKRRRFAFLSFIKLIKLIWNSKILFLSSSIRDRFTLRCSIMTNLGYVRGLLI